MIVGAFGTSTFLAGRHLSAETWCATEWNSTMNLNWKPYLSEINKAISRNPGNAEYHWKRAEYFINSRVKSETLRKETNEAAIKSLEQVVRLNPTRGSHWVYLGKRYSFRSYDQDGYFKKWLPLTDECFDMAVKCDSVDSKILFDVAWYWVWRSGVFPKRHNFDFSGGSGGTVRFRDEGIKKFQRLFRRSIEIDPDRLMRAADRVWEYYPDDSIVLGIVPEKNEKIQKQLMRYLAKKPNN